MPRSGKTKVAVLISDPQSHRLSRLFALPEFADSFSVSYIDLNRVGGRHFSRLYQRGRAHFQSDDDSSSSSDWRVRYLTKRHLKGVQVVLGLDNQLSILNNLAELSTGNLRAAAIQMGTNPRYYRRSLTQDRGSSVTLLSWGNREIEQYSRDGLVPNRIVPIGSLMRALSRNSQPKQLTEPNMFDVCIISQFRPSPSPNDSVSESAHAESESMPALLSLLCPILRDRSLKTVVALRAGKLLSNAIKLDEERECFEKHLDAPFRFTNQNDLYSSYSAAASSRITIGRNSGLLFENIGSTSRVLFVNPTQWTLFDPPSAWPFGQKLPSVKQLDLEIENLITMTDGEYLEKTQEAVDLFCTNKVDTLAQIRDTLLG